GVVEVEDRAELRGQALEDSALPRVRVRVLRHPLAERARARDVLDVLVLDRADLAEVDAAFATIALDHADEGLHDRRMELRPAAPHELGHREVDALRGLVRALA